MFSLGQLAAGSAYIVDHLFWGALLVIPKSLFINPLLVCLIADGVL